MVLQGLVFPSWLGWLTGIYYVKKPWGTPEFTGWCHIYCLYSICINVIMQAFWFDFQMKTTDLVNSPSLAMQLLAKAMIIGNCIFDLYFRATFGMLKGKVPKLLEEIEKEDLQLTPRCLLCWKIQRVFMWVILIPRFLSMVVFTMWYQRIVPAHTKLVISSPWYFIMFFIMGVIPAATSVIFAYDYVLVTTLHVVRIFENFCASIEQHILKINESSISPSCSIIALAENDDEDFVKCNNFKPSLYLRNPREIFIEQFEKVKKVFEMYDAVVGMLVLGLLMRTVFIAIHSINSLMLTTKEETTFKCGYDILNLVTEIPQLVLLKLGDTAHQKITNAKEHLHKMAILLPRSTERDEVLEIINFVLRWKWKITACNLFTLSSQLMAGIVTTTMSYVVILFQLHLSESQSPNPNITLSDSQQSVFE